ncbi:MAG TPA: alkyl sulfatase dimerization domain-containing protein [Candidatus Binataceae bacterium]|nr:alkyl sulfatase dimerization domain-containing protein [Candidatus Binataceae bacterium]
MGTIRELSEKLLSGEASIREHHPFLPSGELEEIADGVAFFHWFANFSAVKTAEGLVMVDTGMTAGGTDVVAMLRRYSPARVNSAIYTHGDVDHVAGMHAIALEAGKNRAARPRVVGHRAIAAHLDRYRRTAAYDLAVHRRQFASRAAEWPAEFVYPDTYFDHQFNLAAGSHRFECHYARGATDDSCWVYLPQGKVLFAGDFIIWAAPAAGNPSGALCYAREWAEALRAMAKSGAEVMVPGHGLPVFGAIRIRQVLNETAEYLQSIYDQALKLLNDGAPLDIALNEVTPPAALADRPYLRAIYDEPEYIVRNVYRLEGGWYDGRPSHLKPATMAEQGQEITALAGGTSQLVARAMSRFNAGDLKLAAHLIDWAYAAAPDDPAVNHARMQMYGTRAEQSQALITRGVFKAAQHESAAKIGLAGADEKN